MKDQNGKENNRLTEVPAWQQEAFKKLVESKIIKDPEAWENRLAEKITIGEVVGIIANMI